MKTSTRIASLLLPLTLTAALLAQTADVSPENNTRRGGPGHGHGRGPGGPGGPGGFGVIRVLDGDQDRELSAAEIANAPAALRTLDVNNDGTVSNEELRPARPDRPDRPGHAKANTERPARPERPASADAPRHGSPLMLALDADNNHSLSPTEIANASTSLAALDADKDGKLSAEEIRPFPPEGAPAGKGPRGGRGPRN